MTTSKRVRSNAVDVMCTGDGSIPNRREEVLGMKLGMGM
jgi:hypothetical protein